MSILDTVSGSAVIAQAQTWLGVPYLYGGGRSSTAQARVAGVDCSGLVYQVFSALGVNPGTDTVAQFNNPDAATVPSLAQAQQGDLVFFGSPVGGTQEHVGIYLGNDLMIDAPHTGASVRIDSVTGFGEPILGIKRIALTGAQLPDSPDGSTVDASALTSNLDAASLASSSSSLATLAVQLVAVAVALALVAGGIYITTQKDTSQRDASKGASSA